MATQVAGALTLGNMRKLGSCLNADLGFIDNKNVYDGRHLGFIDDKDVYDGGRFHYGNAVLQFAPTKNRAFHKSQKRYRNAHNVGGPKMTAKDWKNILLH